MNEKIMDAPSLIKVRSSYNLSVYNIYLQSNLVAIFQVIEYINLYSSFILKCWSSYEFSYT